MNLTDRIAAFIASERMIPPGGKVVVGLSGGADSVALLALLSELGYACVALHCHFGLRDTEADRDLEHSRAIAARLGAEFHEIRFDTRAFMARHGLSAEMACRRLRYDEFERLRRDSGADVIAVGHHREDNIEGLFLALLRGAGLHGVKGMLPRRDRIVRPLLLTPRADLLEYLGVRNLSYVVDSTNLENDFQRNRLRNIVIPALMKEFPGAADALTDSLAHLRGCDALYTSLIPSPGRSLSPVRASAAPVTLLHEWLMPYGFNETQCADMLRAASAGAEFVSPTHRLTLLPRDGFELTALADEIAVKPRLEGKILPRPSNFRPRSGVLYLDGTALDGNPVWQLRPWHPGDRIRPFGMKGSRPVSDLLAEAGISASGRRRCFLLTRNETVLWIVGIRASAHFPVTEHSRKIIEIHSHEKV